MDSLISIVPQVNSQDWQVYLLLILTLTLLWMGRALLRQCKSNQSQTEFLKKAMHVVSHAVVITDRNGVIIEANPAYSRLTGYSKEDILGKTPKQLSHSGTQTQSFYEEMWQSLQQHRHWHGELINQTKSGEHYYQEMQISGITDAANNITHYIGIAHNISDRKQAEKRNMEQAKHDPLTGLPNRVLFFERLDEAFEKAKNNQTSFSLLFIDLDGFKPINDQHGHNIGDKVLKTIAHRLKDHVSQQDTVARYGGDEYVIILAPSHTPVTTIAEQLVQLVKQPIHYAELSTTLKLSASIGIATYPEDGCCAEQLISIADKNMYQHKAANKPL